VRRAVRGQVWAGVWAGLPAHPCLSLPMPTRLNTRLTMPDRPLPEARNEGVPGSSPGVGSLLFPRTSWPRGRTRRRLRVRRGYQGLEPPRSTACILDPHVAFSDSSFEERVLKVLQMGRFVLSGRRTRGHISGHTSGRRDAARCLLTRPRPNQKTAPASDNGRARPLTCARLSGAPKRNSRERKTA
jgi:hypothetical protein